MTEKNQSGMTAGLKAGATTKQVIQSVYNEMNGEFKAHVDPALLNSITDFGKALFNYAPGVNEFFASLINKIAYTFINFNEFKNPLASLKKGMLEMGDTIEDVYVAPIKAMLYQPEVDNSNPGDLFKTYKPEVSVVYHKKNKEFVYPLTINEIEARKAFRSYADLDKYIAGLLTQVYNGDEIDDFELTQDLLGAYKNIDSVNRYYRVHVSAVTDESTAKELIRKARAYFVKMQYPTNKYNFMGVDGQFSRKDRIHLIMSADVEAIIDVDVLARAFNMDKTTLLGRIHVLPEFGGSLASTQLIMCDEDFFQIWDSFKEMKAAPYNALHLTQNYFFHHDGVFSLSPFYNAIEFTSDTISAVTAVAINGDATISKGQKKAYTASVTDGETAAVVWEIVNKPQYVHIDQTGNVFVSKNAPASLTSFDIKVTTIALDGSSTAKTATKTVTVS